MIKIKTCKYCKEYFKQDTEDKFKGLVCLKCRPRPKKEE